MRRAERLFEIIQCLRRANRPVTADQIALELETSKRSVYRDVAALIAQRVPIRGEAGVGYVLEAGFDMPPLMLTAEEVEAAVLGAQWVAGRGDASLSRAAENLIAKLSVSLPKHLQVLVSEPALATPPPWNVEKERIDLVGLRAAIGQGQKARLRYGDEQGRESERVIWPFLIGYRETTRMVAAWCESRDDFRHFRTERIHLIQILDERYPVRPATLRRRWRAMLRAKYSVQARTPLRAQRAGN